MNPVFASPRPLLASLGALALLFSPAGSATGPEVILVTTVADHGPGSLRQAIETANAGSGGQRILFGSATGLFSSPQTIELQAPLPLITGDVSIDGRINDVLWKPYGATISGGGKHRVFEVAPGGKLQLTGLTITAGAADRGAGILNQGRLLVEGVSFTANRARGDGGALGNDGGSVVLVNSTATDNDAARGGAVANLRGSMRITHGTLYENRAGTGSDLFNAAQLTLANSIVAGRAGERCVNTGELRADSTHNLITGHRGCGQPVIASDPRLEKLGYFNGPTPVLALGGGSPAINLADRASAIDADGHALVWDQRGNGDPRFAAGFADLGAFEQQPPNATELLVDTVSDTGLRACSLVGEADCPLRAALELAAVAVDPVVIRFSPDVFAQAQTLALSADAAGAAAPLVFDGAGAAPVTIRIARSGLPWQLRNGVHLQTRGPDAHTESGHE
jgi:hypothetical protein